MINQPPRAKPPHPLDGRIVIGLDTETHLIAPGRNCPRLICTTLAGTGSPPTELVTLAATCPLDTILTTGGGRWKMLLGRAAGITAVFGLIPRSDVVLIAHNAVFDLSVLAEADDTGALLHLIFDALEAGRIKCTRNREWLLANALNRVDFDHRTNRKAPGFSLADCVLAHFGNDISGEKKDPTAWRLRYHELDGIPVTEWPEKSQHYAVEDAVWSLEVAGAQSGFQQADNGETIADEHGGIIDEDYQIRADWALRLMSCWGPRTDAAKVEQWREELQASVDAANLIAEEAGFVVNGSRKMAIMRARIDKAYGGKAPQTKTGKTSTARDVLLGSGDEALITYANAGVDRKNLTTYLPILLRGVDHPLTSRPNVLVKSGRTSWKNPSLQTGPRGGDYRKSFKAREGMCYVAADYDRIELAALGQIHYWMFGTSALRDAFLAGEDVHLSLAAEMMGLTYAEALARYEAGNPEVDRVRQGAKIGNFGFPGGLVAQTFVGYAEGFGIDMSLGRAQEIRDAWFRRWPEMVPYFEQVQSLTKWGESTISQWVSGRQRSGCTYNVAANTWFQGLTADGAKRALFALAKECYTVPSSPLYGVRPWVFIHDEVIAEGPEATVHLWAPRMVEIMEEAMREVIPDVPISAAAIASRRWDKKAKTVIKDGRLVCWEPTQ